MRIISHKELKMIEKRSIENLLNNVDIVDLISSYVTLKKSGSSWAGLCPFHNEKSPSMHVNSAKGYFHCFGCGKGGNAINFVMEYEKLGFVAAVEKIADMFGITLEYTKDNSTHKDNSSKEILEILNNYYKTELFAPQNSRALAYLKDRALNSAMIEKFELGWAPASTNSINILKKANVPYEKALSAGAVKSGENGVYASFSNRITFPIFNHLGVLVGFGGRTIDEHPAKYINSPQSDVFDKSRILYGYDKARQSIFKQGEIIICEGYMDCIMLHQAGFFNAVAVLGTALTTKHLPLLKKENIKVVLSFDSDKAGQAAALRSAEILSLASIDGRVVLIEGGKDPAELVAAGKESELARIYKGGVELVEFVLRKKVELMPTNTPLEKANALDALREYVSGLRAEIISFYEPLVAQILGMDIKSINLRNFRAKRQNSTQNYEQNSIQNSNNFATQKKDILELSVLKNIIENADFKAMTQGSLNPKMFKNPQNYERFVRGDESFLRELEMDESLETYSLSQFKSAFNTLLCNYFESEKERIAKSDDSDKLAQIKQINLAIEKLKKEINEISSTF